MKIILTGSLGRIGKPLAKMLVDNDHTVTVISSSPERSMEIEEIGALPAIGSLQDTDFLSSCFEGADVVYTMVPPANYFDHELDLVGYFRTLGAGFATAIGKTGVNRVVNMSSIGAHMANGNGILEGTYQVEKTLDALPEEVAVTHIRPTEIYYNLYNSIDLIKGHGIMAGNLAGNDVNVWVSPEDIASVTVEEIINASTGRKVRYVASDELTYDEMAGILGNAIGKPDLKWVQISDSQLSESLINVGMQPAIAEKMTEMYAAIHSGLLYEDYRKHTPDELGKVKMKDFARDFVASYHRK
ncbi:MAG: NAD(P)H-binding protein [Cyclobacteriaceae bacterium]